MANNNPEIEQVKKDGALFKQKAETDRKIEYYTDTLDAITQQQEGIGKRLEKGYTESKYKVFGFIPVSKKLFLDDYDQGRLINERVELVMEMFVKQRYLKMWTERDEEYQVRFEEITKECEEYFDGLLNKAKEIADKYNLRLADGIEKYSNPDNNQKIKNEFYLYLKVEVSNAYNNTKELRKDTKLVPVKN